MSVYDFGHEFEYLDLGNIWLWMWVWCEYECEFKPDWDYKYESIGVSMSLIVNTTVSKSGCVSMSLCISLIHRNW